MSPELNGSGRGMTVVTGEEKRMKRSAEDTQKDGMTQEGEIVFPAIPDCRTSEEWTERQHRKEEEKRKMIHKEEHKFWQQLINWIKCQCEQRRSLVACACEYLFPFPGEERDSESGR
jgi:hypothetical protein